MKPAADTASDAPRPAALFLAPETPYPMAGGGALRSASLLEYLARRYNLDVLVFREPGAPDPRLHFPSHLARRIGVLDLPPNRRHALARACRNTGRLLRGVTPLVDRFSGFHAQIAAFLAGRRYELAVIEHSWCAPYQEQAAAVAARTVLDLHNIESLLHARCARAGGFPALAHRFFAPAALAFERRWLPRFDVLLTASEQEARQVRRMAPSSTVLVYPNALPPMPPPPRAEQHVVAFSGNLEYHPNHSAVRFFAREIWPRLRARHPGLTWRLIGKNEHAVRRFLSARAGIECTGPVPDAVAELARAKVAVVPLLAGSGTRLKILEAWAAATPVVSTSIGAEGLGAADGEHILLADNPPAFARAVDTLLADPSLRRRIGCAGRALYESRYTWPAAWAGLDL